MSQATGTTSTNSKNAPVKEAKPWWKFW